MYYCIKCGENLSNEENNCPNCGYINKFKLLLGKNKQGDVETKSTRVKQSDNNRSKMAFAGFILSIVGLFTCELTCGILGLIFSNIGLYDIKRKGKSGKGFAIAGLVLSIIQIILWVALICFFVVYYEKLIYYLSENPTIYY